MEVSTEFYWIAVAIVAITSSARITRLVTVDKFPPIQWIRHKYEDATDGTDWVWLVLCGYCFSFWATLGVVAAGYFSDWHEVWWFVNGVLGASYLAAILMAIDADNGEDD